MSGFGASPKDIANIPISSSYVPDTGLIAAQGSPNIHTDGSGNESTPVLTALAASFYTSGTLQNAQTGNSNGTALPVLGYASVMFTVNMAGFTGSVTFKASEDGTNYDPINVGQAGTGPIGTSITTTSATTSIHCYEASIAGYQSVEAVTSGVTAGNVTVTAHAIPINIAPRTVNAARSAIAVYTLASTTTSGSTQNSGDIAVGLYTEISIDITTTAQGGTSPTIQYFYERKGADGLYYVLWQSAILTTAANTISTSIGSGMAYNQSLGLTGRLRWVIGGSATPTYTHSINIYGK